jgi:hypothetical protein
MHLDPKDIGDTYEAALAELAAEERRRAVDAEKERILARRDMPLWRVLFPWTIKIERYKPRGVRNRG